MKKICLIGTYIKKLSDALELAEKKSINGQTFSVIGLENSYLIVNDKILEQYENKNTTTTD